MAGHSSLPGKNQGRGVVDGVDTNGHAHRHTHLRIDAAARRPVDPLTGNSTRAHCITLGAISVYYQAVAE